MKGAEKTKKQFMADIDSLRKKIKRFENVERRLKQKEKKLKEFTGTLEERVSHRTSAERIICKQLHDEIDQRQRAERVIEDALAYAKSIIDTVRRPLIVLNAELKVISASRSFYQIFNVKPEDTEKQHIYDLGNRQWNIPKLRELLEEILPRATSFDDFEVEHDFPDLGKRIMLLNAREIHQKVNRTKLILLAIEDVTARRELEEKVKTAASHDELTGCVNFGSTMKFIENEIARSERYDKEFTIIMIDIDNFKRINDEHGHQAGNDALIAFTTVVKNSVRSVDVAGRYGGEEFIIVLPESVPQDALVVLERIRNNLARTKITSPYIESGKEITLKFSAGIVSYPYNAKDLKELIWVADCALRQAKQEGKNRAVLEKRKLIRRKPLPGTRMKIVDPSGEENADVFTIANITREGMLVLSAQDIPDEELVCRLYAPETESPCELTCAVKHRGKAAAELYRTGVSFSYIPESMKEKLSPCVGAGSAFLRPGPAFLNHFKAKIIHTRP
jgi:diguanylate cyclase (GGDEF)-like protein/PAS domain S-box-containing protein